MNEEIEYDPIYDSIVQQIKQIDRDDLSDDVDQGPLSSEVEKQKVYIWIQFINIIFLTRLFAIKYLILSFILIY
jgi:hypothetical protein